MTYDLKIERLIDAPPSVVFDAFVDPKAQKVLYTDENEPAWTVQSNLDLRVGGTWTIAFGRTGEEPYRETNVFAEVERPRRIVFDSTMFMAEERRTFPTTVTVTFEAGTARPSSPSSRPGLHAKKTATGSKAAGRASSTRSSGWSRSG